MSLFKIRKSFGSHSCPLKMMNKCTSDQWKHDVKKAWHTSHQLSLGGQENLSWESLWQFQKTSTRVTVGILFSSVIPSSVHQALLRTSISVVSLCMDRVIERKNHLKPFLLSDLEKILLMIDYVMSLPQPLMLRWDLRILLCDGLQGTGEWLKDYLMILIFVILIIMNIDIRIV